MPLRMLSMANPKMRNIVLGLIAASIGIALIVGLGGAAVVSEWWMARQPLPVGGRLLLPNERELVLYDLLARRATSLVSPARGEIVTSAAWSPDGSFAVYGLFHRPAGDPTSAAEIFYLDVDSGESRPLAQRDHPGTILDMPVVSPDGRWVYFSYIGQIGRQMVQRIDRVELSSGQRETVVDAGYAPTLSADGDEVYYLRDEREGMSLWRQALPDGQPSSVIAAGKYPALAAPRVSPDGRTIAVAVMNSTLAHTAPRGPFDWLGPPTAAAHGTPWDLWTFDRDGASPRRLTQVNADEPSPAWSPDGAYIAFWGGTGLYIVDADGSGIRRVMEQGGYGAIDWYR